MVKNKVLEMRARARICKRTDSTISSKVSRNNTKAGGDTWLLLQEPEIDM
jgi:hypothetical protein